MPVCICHWRAEAVPGEGKQVAPVVEAAEGPVVGEVSDGAEDEVPELAIGNPGITAEEVPLGLGRNTRLLEQLALGGPAWLLTRLDTALDQLHAGQGMAKHQDISAVLPMAQNHRAGLADRRHSRSSVLAQQSDETALNLDAIWPEDAGLIGWVRSLKRDGITLAAQALKGGFFIVHESNNDLARAS